MLTNSVVNSQVREGAEAVLPEGGLRRRQRQEEKVLLQKPNGKHLYMST